MLGVLYLIPSLLGKNDAGLISENTCAAVKKLNCFIVENAKEARRFLKVVHPAINFQETEMLAFDKHEKNTDWSFFLAPLLNGKDAGLISDCGCPAVADPGSGLVAAAHRHGITVKPLTGPSSILLALMASGLNGQSFVFHGYLPVEKELLIAKIRSMEKDSRQNNQTQIFIETPYRNESLFSTLLSVLQSSTLLSVSCNLTCDDEWIRTFSAGHWKTINEVHLRKKPCIFLIYAGK